MISSFCLFAFSEALRMWEACWSHYQTDYFHLFICISIMAVYGDDIVQQNLGTDDMLLHFNSLAMHMSGSIVLKKVNIKARFKNFSFGIYRHEVYYINFVYYNVYLVVFMISPYLLVQVCFYLVRFNCISYSLFFF
jgi:hypothetical protein